MKLLSHVQLFATPWTIAYQAPPSMGFSRQGYWSGLPFPSPGDLPNPGIKPRSPALQADALTSEPPGRTWDLKYDVSECIYKTEADSQNYGSLRRDLSFPGSSDGKASACNAGDLGLIPGLRRSPGEGNGIPPQYSCLENSHGQRSLVDYSQ